MQQLAIRKLLEIKKIFARHLCTLFIMFSFVLQWLHFFFFNFAFFTLLFFEESILFKLI